MADASRGIPINTMRLVTCGLAVALAVTALAAGSSVSLPDALAMAKSALAIIQSTGEVPEQIQASLSRGGAIKMKADGAVLFFCNTLLRFQDKGKASDKIDLPAGSTRLRRAPKAPDSKAQEEIARVHTTALTRQCRALPLVFKRTGSLPSAVWVGDRRLSTAQFLGVVLNALSVAKEGQPLPEQVAVPLWQGPRSWPICPPFDPAAAAKSGAAASDLITVKPDGTSPVSGSVSVTVSYSGKLGHLEVLLDGKRRWIGNSSPFSFVWKTETVEDGEHRLTVQAVDKDGSEVRLQRTFTVKNSS